MIVISRTPLRLSLLGGGSDFPAFFREHTGATVSFGINKYVNVIVKWSPNEPDRYRLIYRLMEEVQQRGAINHPLIRQLLHDYSLTGDFELHVVSDCPSSSGLGTSSSFAIGLILALEGLSGRDKLLSRDELARRAIYVEREVLNETGGWQDQIIAAHGGFRYIKYGPGPDFFVRSVDVDEERQNKLMSNLYLVPVGGSRRSYEIEEGKLLSLNSKLRSYSRLRDIALEFLKALEAGGDLDCLGELLMESWRIKNSLASGVTSPLIEETLAYGLKCGALGGKLLGAGQGGFLLMYVPNGKKENFEKRMSSHRWMSVSAADFGSRIIFKD